MDILDKLKKLLEMTASPAEEEARTAAALACKLIREHAIELRLPGTPKPNVQKVGVHDGFWADGLFADAQRRAENERMAKMREAARGPRVSVDPVKERVEDIFHTSQPKRVRRFKEDPVTLRLSYSTTCKQCGLGVMAGNMGMWLKGEGVTHTFCTEYWTKEAP